MDIDNEMATAEKYKSMGKKSETRDILRRILASNKYNENAWLLFSEVAESISDEERCLRYVLQINPQNEIAQQRLLEIQSRPKNTFQLSRYIIYIISGIGILLFGCLILLFIGVKLLASGSTSSASKATSVPSSPKITATLVPIIINARTLIGITPEDVRNHGFNIDNGEVPIVKGEDDQFPDGGFMIGYFRTEVDKNSFDMFFNLLFTPQRISKEFETGILLPYHFHLQDWAIIGHMFGVTLDNSPDVVNIDHRNGKEFSYEWTNWNGYFIFISREIDSDYVYYFSICRIDIGNSGICD